MKKLLLSILTFLYLAVSSGVAMEIHYCMGKRAGVDLYKTAEASKCGRCGMKDKKSGCCNDEHKFYKLENAHKNVSNNHNYDAPVVFIHHEYADYTPACITILTTSYPHNNSPPGDAGVPIYLQNRNFRL